MGNNREQFGQQAPSQRGETPLKEDKKRGVWWGVFPTTVDLLAILGIFLVAQLISLAATIALGYSYDRETLGSDNELLREMAQIQAGKFSLISYSITMFITIVGALILRAIRGCKARIARFSILGFNPTVLLWGMAMIISIAVIFDPLFSLMPEVPQLYGRGWGMVLSLMVVAPIAEEFLCRGIILESVRAKSGVWAACSISAIFFAVLHFHPTAAVNALVIGLVLSYIYIRSGSLFAPIILHAFNNALAYILVWLGYENATLWELLRGNRVIYISIYAAAAFIFVVSAIKIIRQLTRIRKAQKVISTDKIGF